MFVDALASLRGAFDRRARVDRLLDLEPVRALDERVDGAKRDATDRTAARPASAVSTPQPSGLGARLVVGATVTLRVIAVPDAARVVAELDDQRFELAWPVHDAPLPMKDQNIALRVLTTEPTLTFARTDGPTPTTPIDLAGPRFNDQSTQLRAVMPAADPQGDAPRSGVVRFAAPLLAPRALPASVAPGGSASRDADPIDAMLATAPHDAHPATAAVDPVTPHDDAPAPARLPVSIAGTQVASSLVPLVLHGPAWQDQPLEIVFHRERADESFDNAALDAWCGEVTIDLPTLGRVAAHLAFSMHGLRVRIEADGDDALSDLSAASRDLAAAFAAADLRVAQLSVGPLAADAMHGPASAYLLRSDFIHATR